MSMEKALRSVADEISEDLDNVWKDAPNWARYIIFSYMRELEIILLAFLDKEEKLKELEQQRLKLVEKMHEVKPKESSGDDKAKEGGL